MRISNASNDCQTMISMQLNRGSAVGYDEERFTTLANENQQGELQRRQLFQKGVLVQNSVYRCFERPGAGHVFEPVGTLTPSSP